MLQVTQVSHGPHWHQTHRQSYMQQQGTPLCCSPYLVLRILSKFNDMSRVWALLATTSLVGWPRLVKKPFLIFCFDVLHRQLKESNTAGHNRAVLTTLLASDALKCQKSVQCIRGLKQAETDSSTGRT